MIVTLDSSNLTDFERNILEKVRTNFPKEGKKFMQRVGNAFRKDLRASYKAQTKKKTGNLLKGLSRGRAYVYNGDELQVRVKNTAPHAHLIEYGHKLYFHHKGFAHARHNGGWVKGKGIVRSAIQTFGAKYTDMAKEFVDDFLEKGFY